jgi:hypothetical protein
MFGRFTANRMERDMRPPNWSSWKLGLSRVLEWSYGDLIAAEYDASHPKAGGGAGSTYQAIWPSEKGSAVSPPLRENDLEPREKPN